MKAIFRGHKSQLSPIKLCLAGLTLIIPGIFLILSCAAGAGRSETVNLDSIFNVAEYYFEKQDLDSASIYIEKCLKQDYRYSPALHLQAKILIRGDNIYDRRRASELLKRAISLSPNIIEYRLTLASLYENQEFFRNALEEYEKIAEVDPSNIESQTKINEINNTFGLKFDDYKSFRRAESAITAALRYSQSPALYYQKAISCYYLGLFDSSANASTAGISQQPDTALMGNLYLILGACYVRQSKFDSAYIAFDHAHRFISRALADEINDIRYLLPPDQYNKLLDETPYIREKTISRFWGQLDPDPITEYNERKLEHYSRFVHAQLAFSIPNRSISGWKTKRGEIFIRYGRPSEMTYLLDSAGETGVIRQWIWTYSQFSRPITLTFEDTFLNGEFEFPYPKKNWSFADYDNNPARIAAQLSVSNPQIFSYAPGAGVLDFNYSLKQFRGPGSKTDLEVLYALPFSRSLIDTLIIQNPSALYVRQVLRYPSWRIADSVSVFKYYQPGFAGQFPDSVIADKMRLSTFPDSLRFSISITDTLSKFVGIKTAEMRLREFSRNKVEISDLILASRIIRPTDSKFLRNDIIIETDLMNKFRRDEPVWIYFEIYNLEIGPDKLSYYSIKQSVSERKSGGVISNLKSAVTGGKLKEVITSYIGKGSQSNEYRTMTTDVSSLKPGKYTLTIEIEDLNSDRVVSASEDFEVYK